MSTNDRLFNFSDAELIEHGEVTAEALPDDIVDFIAFDSTIEADYPVKISNALAKHNAIKPDMLIVNEQAELTQKVNTAIAACNTSFKTILFFAKKAFAGNNAVQKQFGINEIDKVRKNQPKLVLFMETLAETATKYKAELVAAGCNPAVIEQLPVQSEALRIANIAQEKSKKERNVTTQERVTIMNEIYGVLKPIHEIAQIIYSDDPARLAKYSLPYPKSSNNNPEDLVQS